MSYRIILLFAACAFFSCDIGNTPKGKKKNMTYSYACLDSALAGGKVNRTLGRAGDVLRNLAVDESAVTDEVQSQYGEAFHQDAISSGNFKLIKDVALQGQLQGVLDELLKVREQPSSIKYFIYALDDSAVNAFTFGGRIYITKAMIARCKGRPDLLYSIIGHEIGHSEKGHIKKTIQEMKLAEKYFGEENGQMVLQVKQLLTASFNQRNELEADYYGTDLSYRLDRDVCAAVLFWNEMSKEENRYSQFEDFFRTHPFSALRARCLRDHIKSNFDRDCQ